MNFFIFLFWHYNSNMNVKISCDTTLLFALHPSDMNVRHSPKVEKIYTSSLKVFIFLSNFN